MPNLSLTISGLCVFAFDQPVKGKGKDPTQATLLLQRLNRSLELDNMNGTSHEILDQHFPMLEFNPTELAATSTRVPDFAYAPDARGTMESLDVYNAQAMGILTTSKLAEALDLSKEDPQILARYGKSNEQFQRDGAPPMVENFCLARRLVEAGARFVSMNYSRWDWHGSDGMNYPKSREEFPLLDTGLAALVATAVAQQTREIGVRLALGATAPAIVRSIVAGAARLVAIGIAVGTAGAFAVTRAVSVGDPADPLPFAGAAALLGAVALVDETRLCAEPHVHLAAKHVGVEHRLPARRGVVELSTEHEVGEPDQWLRTREPACTELAERQRERIAGVR